MCDLVNIIKIIKSCFLLINKPDSLICCQNFSYKWQKPDVKNVKRNAVKTKRT